MKAIGIICEYNPFHNGHLYHLKKIKTMYPNHIIILVMSGHFTQRGEVSIINKWDKTLLALNYGVDLVIELPFVFATQSADNFAYGSIKLLNYLKADKIVFGSEINDINILNKLANIQLNDNYDLLVKKFLDEGINYPTALSKALEHFGGINLNSPNDLLAISYIKAIKKLNSSIEAVCIKRSNDYHQTSLNSKIVSAKAIRNAIKNNKNIKKFVPYKNLEMIKNINNNDYFPYLKYKIISCNNLNSFLDVDEGIENKLKTVINNCYNIDDLIKSIKTKRYTYNKLMRMFIHILCDLPKQEFDLNYIRPLGFNKNGQLYLNKIKKSLEVPLITKYNKLLDYEIKVTSIYSLIFNDNSLILKEYQNKPIIK